jgi:FKBP-type peptidyl-prolyl cis-trans isomerase SlpA
MKVIAAQSHVTLHYRVAILDQGEERELVNTFEAAPATLQMGAGQWAPLLEERLIGLAEGAQSEFDVAAADAYGDHNPSLVRRLTRDQLEEYFEPGTMFEVGETVQLRDAGDGPVRGLLVSCDEEGGDVDFNHPLAGHPVRVRVRIVGIL